VAQSEDASPLEKAASPIDLSTPAAPAAARPAQGNSPDAAYEQSIARAQKIQMESLQRQLKVQSCCHILTAPA